MRTKGNTILGSSDNRAMPLSVLLDEVTHILRSQPDATEIAVQRVEFLRNAEADGRRDQVLAMLSGAH